MTQTHAVEATLHRGKQRDRALVHAAGATLIARLLSAGATIATLAVAAHALTKPELGVVAVLTMLITFLGFGDFGLGTLLMTRLPAAQAVGDTAESRRIVTISFSTLCFTGAAIGGLGALSAFVLPWGHLLGAAGLSSGDVRASVISFFVAGAVSIPATLGGRMLAALLRAATAQLWLAVTAVVSLVATIACAALALPVWTFVVAIAGMPALVAAVQTGWVFVSAFPQLRPRTLIVPFAEALSFVRAGALFAIMSLSAVIAYSIDSLVVSSNIDASAAAVFVVAARMYALVGGTIGLAGQQLWSALTDAITRGDAAWARSRFRNTLLISMAINAGACSFLVLTGQTLARLWVGASLVPPLSLLVWMAVYTVYSTAINQATYLLAAVEKVGFIAACGVVMAVVNVIASIELTRRYGLSGPILGSIVGLALIITWPVVSMTRTELRRLDDMVNGIVRLPVGRHRAPKG